MSEETAAAAAPVNDGIDIADLADLFKDDSTKPESNWFQFAEVGDTIQGKLVMEPFESEGKFGPQTVYVVQTADGKEYNVALKNQTQKVLIQQMKSAEVGDIVAFRYTDNIDTGKINPAKRIELRIRKTAKS